MKGPAEFPPFTVTDGAGLVLHNTVIDFNGNAKFVATVEGKVVQYDMNEVSLHTLGDVRNSYWLAFGRS